jgi:hypothetical protein
MMVPKRGRRSGVWVWRSRSNKYQGFKMVEEGCFEVVVAGVGWGGTGEVGKMRYLRRL